MERLPGLRIGTTVAAFDVATTMPYLFCDMMKDDEMNILVMRFECLTETIQTELMYFLSMQPRLANRNASCHICAVSFDMKRISHDTLGRAKRIVYCIDMVIFSRKREDAAALVERFTTNKNCTERYAGISMIDKDVVQSSYEVYMHAIGNGFCGY